MAVLAFGRGGGGPAAAPGSSVSPTTPTGRSSRSTTDPTSAPSSSTPTTLPGTAGHPALIAPIPFLEGYVLHAVTTNGSRFNVDVGSGRVLDWFGPRDGSPPFLLGTTKSGFVLAARSHLLLAGFDGADVKVAGTPGDRIVSEPDGFMAQDGSDDIMVYDDHGDLRADLPVPVGAALSGVAAGQAIFQGPDGIYAMPMRTAARPTRVVAGELVLAAGPSTFAYLGCSATLECAVRFHDLRTGNDVAGPGLSAQLSVDDVGFTSDGAHYIQFDPDHGQTQLVVIDTHTGRAVATWALPPELRGPRQSAMVSPDDRFVVFVSRRAGLAYVDLRSGATGSVDLPLDVRRDGALMGVALAPAAVLPDT